MADICCGVVSDGESPAPGARRRRMEIQRFKFVTGVSTATTTATAASDSSDNNAETKRQRLEISSSSTSSFSRECDCDVMGYQSRDFDFPVKSLGLSSSTSIRTVHVAPKFGVASVCGRRRDMEDAVAVHPAFHRSENNAAVSELHYFAVYDGHGCSHVAMKCRDRLHEIVKEEVLKTEAGRGASSMEWKLAMESSFNRMDKEVISGNEGGVIGNCRCELQTPECDAVGSTAVVAVITPDKIIVANCGDSRAVLCRDGKPVPLSSDHKPDRPDELNRIEEAGGRVIYWDGPRVLGVLAMSRAIGDNYLKPYVSCDPEVTITDRTAEDDCLILASDGLWDVVSNDTACGVAKMCLRGKVPISPEVEAISGAGGDSGAGGGLLEEDKACSDASMLLTKLALARHSTDNVSVVVVDLRSDT